MMNSVRASMAPIVLLALFAAACHDGVIGSVPVTTAVPPATAIDATVSIGGAAGITVTAPARFAPLAYCKGDWFQNLPEVTYPRGENINAMVMTSGSVDASTGFRLGLVVYSVTRISDHVLGINEGAVPALIAGDVDAFQASVPGTTLNIYTDLGSESSGSWMNLSQGAGLPQADGAIVGSDPVMELNCNHAPFISGGTDRRTDESTSWPNYF